MSTNQKISFKHHPSQQRTKAIIKRYVNSLPKQFLQILAGLPVVTMATNCGYLPSFVGITARSRVVHSVITLASAARLLLLLIVAVVGAGLIVFRMRARMVVIWGIYQYLPNYPSTSYVVYIYTYSQYYHTFMV